MESPNISHLDKPACAGRGFTLIEVVITVGLIAIIASLGMFLSFDFYRGFAFLSEQKTIISILQKARNSAMSNINEKPHGVHFEPSCYIVFEGIYDGSGCDDTTHEVIIVQPTMSIVPPLPPDVIFGQLGANASATAFTLTNGLKSATISIAENGRIDVQ